MPFVHIQILEGRTAEQKKNLITEVTDAVIRSLDANRENIRVVLYEIPKSHWSIGGMTIEERERNK